MKRTVLLVGLSSIVLSFVMVIDLLEVFATAEEPRVINKTLHELMTQQHKQPLIQSTPQPIQQPQPTSTLQANNQSQPQWFSYVGGGNSYTVAYPSNVTVEETPRVTPFDGVESVFTTEYGNTVSIELFPSGRTSYEHFIRSVNNYPDHVSRRIPSATIEGSGFGYYSLGGLQTYAILISKPSGVGHMFVGRVKRGVAVLLLGFGGMVAISFIVPFPFSLFIIIVIYIFIIRDLFKIMPGLPNQP